MHLLIRSSSRPLVHCDVDWANSIDTVQYIRIHKNVGTAVENIMKWIEEIWRIATTWQKNEVDEIQRWNDRQI